MVIELNVRDNSHRRGTGSNDDGKPFRRHLRGQSREDQIGKKTRDEMSKPS